MLSLDYVLWVLYCTGLHWTALYCRDLVKVRAVKMDGLVDASSGHMKPLRVVLMADGWVDHPTDVSACKVQMEQLGMVPALPRGSSHAVADSCHEWPPTDADRRLARQFRHKAKQQAGPAPAPASTNGLDGGADDGTDSGGTTARAAVGARWAVIGPLSSPPAPGPTASGYVAHNPLPTATHARCPRAALRCGALPVMPAHAQPAVPSNWAEGEVHGGVSYWYCLTAAAPGTRSTGALAHEL